MKRLYQCGYILLIVLVISLSSCAPNGALPNENDGFIQSVPPVTEASGPETVPSPSETLDTLDVIIFDVGNADCVLIKTNEHAMLIDAGDIGQDDIILGYLAEYGITKLDYIVTTHSHADHIAQWRR